MTESLIVETNWIIDVVRDQHESSLRLLQLARGERVTLFVPTMSVSESIKAIETKQQYWKELEARLQSNAADLGSR